MTTPTPRPGRTRAAAIRRYTDGDRDAVYEVCVRTGAAGQDASGRYVSDDLIGDIYAGPYLYLEPELAFVLADGDRAVGYVLGTADTSVFVTAYRARWLPLVSPRYPAPEHSADPAERRLLADLLNPERLLRPELLPYPAHLHINLLPDYRRAGHGRSLVETFLRAAAASGARSAHLAVYTANTGARSFYDKIGWHGVQVSDPGPWTFLVRPTS